jgi:hypothetical protein
LIINTTANVRLNLFRQKLILKFLTTERATIVGKSWKFKQICWALHRSCPFLDRRFSHNIYSQKGEKFGFDKSGGQLFVEKKSLMLELRYFQLIFCCHSLTVRNGDNIWKVRSDKGYKFRQVFYWYFLIIVTISPIQSK